MKEVDLQTEICSLQSQLDLLKKNFDEALAMDVKLIEAKNLLREIRLLQISIDELKKKEAQSN